MVIVVMYYSFVSLCNLCVCVLDLLLLLLHIIIVPLPCRSEDKWGRQSSLKTPSQLIRRPSLGFDSMPAEDLAEVLASIDYKLFRRVPVCIFLNRVLLYT